MFHLIDTHCHLQFPQYDADRDAVIKHAVDAGVGMVCVGTDIESSRQAIALAEKYDGIWASVGIHPNDNLKEVFNENEFRKLACHAKVVSIGETGLDYYRSPDKNERRIQHERFQKHVALAQELQKPIIIHCRDAFDDTISVLHASRSMLHGVIHSFTGTIEEARAYIDLGFLIGLNGIITFSDSYHELVDNLPLDSILCETDSPYLAPVPYRGQRNEPANVIAVARHIASIKNVSFEEVYRVTTQNAVSLFKL